MNVLVLGARVIGVELVLAFVAAQFTNEERHIHRPAKMQAIEKRYSGEISAAKGKTFQ